MYFRCAIQRQGDSYSSQTFLCFSCPVYGTLCGNTCHAGSGREDETNLKSHLELAKALGAKIVTVYGEDAAYQIAEYAIVSNVSKVVMGRTNHRGIWRRPRIEVMEKLTHMAPNIDVYIIPDIRKETHKREVQIQRRRKTSWKNVFLDLAEITGVMAVATLAAYVLWLFRLPESNIIMIYILGILLSSYIANRKFMRCILL